MKCENCGHELIGGQIICRGCNHNNAMQRVSDWRHRRTGELAQPTAAEKPTIHQTIDPRLERPEREATLIKFPASTTPTTRQTAQPLAATAEETEASDVPDWRAQLKEKVRQAREKKSGQLTLPTAELDEADLDPNPIVEAALKRIRWSSPNLAPVAPPRPARQSRSSAALAEEFTAEIDPHHDPEPRVSRSAAQRINQIEPQSTIQRAELPGKPPISRQPSTNRTETKTLAPRPGAETKTKPERRTEIRNQPVAPVVSSSIAPAKVLTPLSKATTRTQEAKVAEPAIENLTFEELGSKTDPNPLLAIKVKDSGKRVATQIIEVPPTVSEMPEVSGRAATLWVRTLAGACDFEIISIAYLPVFAAYATLNTSLGTEAFFILTILLSAITFVYQAVTLSIGGRTFGMALLNLHLLKTEDPELPISRRRLMLRAWAATIAFLCPPLNLILMRLNRRHLSFPDLISGTSPIE